MLNRRDFIAGGGSAVLAGLATNGLAMDVSSPQAAAVTIDPWTLVDPELVPGLKRLMALASRLPSAPQLSTAEILPGTAPLPPPSPQAVEKRIPGPSGGSDLRILIVEPKGPRENRPALLHTHGGGFVSGTAEFSRSLQRIVDVCSCVIVSVDYRLAPATPFPGSLEDNYAALSWLYQNAAELGVDRKRIAVGGESAGGGHAAILAIAARDRREIPLAFQWLIYPMLDDRTGTSRKVPQHIGSFIWTPESNRHGWTSFLGVKAGSAQVPIGAVPARIGDVAGLPPAFIGVGALDLFVDENVEYARRLNAAGVPVELHVVPGAYHGFDLIAPEAQVSRRFAQNWLDALSKALTGKASI